MNLRRKIKDENKIKMNRATLFLLPVIGQLSGLKSYMDYSRYFIDSYILDEESPKLVFCFDNEDAEDLNMIFYKLANDYTLVENGVDEDELFSVHYLPTEYRKDYFKFKEGKFSEFSDNIKEKIMKGHQRTTAIDKRANGLPGASVWDILNPSDKKKREMANYLGVHISTIKELIDPPDMELEKYLTRSQYSLKYQKQST